MKNDFCLTCSFSSLCSLYRSICGVDSEFDFRSLETARLEHIY